MPKADYSQLITAPEKDPLGEAVKDYFYHKALDAEINVTLDISNEKEVIPAKHLFRFYEDMPDLEKIALSACKGKVLDIGAGAGSHALELMNNGFDVMAIDISPGAVEVMKQRGLSKVLHKNMFSVQHEKFDTLLLLMNGVGIVGDLNGLDKYLAHAKTILNPGGQIIFDSSDIGYMYEEEDGSIRLELDRYYGEVIYQMAYKKIQGDPFKWLYVDQNKIKQHAAQQGYDFKLLFEGEEYNYLARLS